MIADIARQIDIDIPGRPPTLNVRRHWRTIARDNASWKAEAANVAAASVRAWEARHGLSWRVLKRVHVSVTFFVPTRGRRDFDNLISTLKPLLDGIVAVGVIADDSSHVIALIDFAVTYEKGRQSTLVQIADLDDALAGTVAS